MNMVDGRGATKVVSNLYIYPMQFKDAGPTDCDAVYSLANDPTVRANALSTCYIGIHEHQSWYAERILRHDEPFLLLYKGSELVAYLRIEKAEIGIANLTIAVSEKWRSQGISSILLKEGIWIARKKGYIQLSAWVKPFNIASQKAFLKAGFKDSGVKEYKTERMHQFILGIRVR
jgi:Sortase and related acyltransferases